MQSQVQQETIFFRSLVIVLSSLFLLPLMARGQAVVVPLEEAKFESPALPPPLWFTNYLVMQDLALRSIRTRQEGEAETAHQFRHKPKIAGSAVSYSHVDGDFGKLKLEDDLLGPEFERTHNIDYDGHIFSTYFKMAWDREHYSLGLFVPYEHLDLDSFDADRIGVLAFGAYTLPIKQVHDKTLFVRFIVNGAYMYNQVDSNIKIVRPSITRKRGFKDFSTLGGNITVALGFDTVDFYRAISTKEGTHSSFISLAGGIAASYQINHDIDVDRQSIQGNRIVDEVETQHLFMLGANVGMRIHDRAAVTLYGIWNHDASDYDGFLSDDADDNYFDLIIEAAVSLWPELRLHGGYKRVLGYDDFNIDQLFVGVGLRF